MVIWQRMWPRHVSNYDVAFGLFSWVSNGTSTDLTATAVCLCDNNNGEHIVSNWHNRHSALWNSVGCTLFLNRCEECRTWRMARRNKTCLVYCFMLSNYDHTRQVVTTRYASRTMSSCISAHQNLFQTAAVDLKWVQWHNLPNFRVNLHVLSKTGKLDS